MNKINSPFAPRPALLPGLLVVMLCCLVTIGKANPSRHQPQAKLRSFKGWELYSWKPKNSKWRFSLLEGTNRNEFVFEIINPQALVGVAALKQRLSQLDAQEGVFWGWDAALFKKSGKRLSYPPLKVTQDIEQFAKQHKLHMSRL